MKAQNLAALKAAGYCQRGNPRTISMAALRNRARDSGYRAKWLPNGLNNNGIGEYVIVSILNNAIIGAATDEDDLREYLAQLVEEVQAA